MNKQLVRGAAALCAGVLAVGCDNGPTRPAPQAPAPAPESLAALAGAYTLTVNLSDQCSALPDAVRRRIYQATLEATPFRYLGITIVGGGFSEPIGSGEIWAAANGRLEIDWNNFDLGGCDGYPEPLPDGSGLMICGVGTGMVDGSTISLALNAEVSIEETGRRQPICHGPHQFTFTRPPS